MTETLIRLFLRCSQSVRPKNVKVCFLGLETQVDVAHSKRSVCMIALSAVTFHYTITVATHFSKVVFRF
ncbi:hypothetical protein L798_13286 [Zootermopsis nevadensis]|uniref:Uncharacterized protein n=1 Tax=Zootermopsis nevadensis TaxID=136037 RepID=A0A067R3G2_ZOONE|nr:hypothetical protein L798_13286 [Zootermopsis nevadensis]